MWGVDQVCIIELELVTKNLKKLILNFKKLNLVDKDAQTCSLNPLNQLLITRELCGLKMCD